MIKSTSSISGFSLVEIIIAIGIFSLLLGVSSAFYNRFGSASQLEIATNTVVESLRSAQAKTMMVNSDTRWGVKIALAQVVIFKGSSYTTRDQSVDQIFSVSGSVIPSGLSEIIFTPVMGNPTAIGTITLSNTAGTKNISINEKGTLSY